MLWKCPVCREEKNILCPVCGKNKKAGETCKNCGSEFSFTLCPSCGFKVYYISEDEIKEEERMIKEKNYIEKIKWIIKNREKPYLTYYELMRLAALISPSSLRKLAVLEPSEIKEKTQKAFEKNSEKALLSIMNKKLANFIMSLRKKK